MSFQSWHKEFDKFWHEHSIVSKIFTLMGSFWAKYVLFEVKSREELSFMILKSDAEFEGNPTCGLENDMRPEYLRVSKLGLSWDPFVQSRKCMSLKFTEELCVMIMKNDTKLKRGWLAVLKLTWGIWQILTRALESLKKKCVLMSFVWPKYVMFELKKYKWVIFKDIEEWCKIWRKTDLEFEKWHQIFSKFSPDHLKISKLGLW